MIPLIYAKSERVKNFIIGEVPETKELIDAFSYPEMNLFVVGYAQPDEPVFTKAGVLHANQTDFVKMWPMVRGFIKKLSAVTGAKAKGGTATVMTDVYKEVLTHLGRGADAVTG